ncbi:hypothetical protein [Brevundimonas denitrificans]|uniref:hypothetical protein n=1 Tax=Brevundimonas denitrificans TaxID=1443434 RepID=UPI00352E980D
MTTSRARLTDLDLHRLIKSGDDDERATAAHKLCRTIDRADLSSADREAAEKILRVLAGDVAEMVRRALAVTLKSSDLLPRDVARAWRGTWTPWPCPSSVFLPPSPMRT